MKKLLHTLAISAAMVAMQPSSFVQAQVSADDRAWINQALSSSRPEKSGDGVMSSGGDQLNPQDYLPPASEDEKQRIEDAKGTYGDDQNLLGAAEQGSQYLAGDGSDTNTGEAFEIVNQEIGFETRIEHKIYQHEVLYEHDLTSDIDTNYYGIAWHDHRNQVGSSSGGGDGFFNTPVPSGKVRSLIAMFAAPIKFGSCERSQVTITGGTAWVPGCNSSGANCERIISNPLSSGLYEYSAYESRYWRWLDGNGNEIQRAEGSEGGISAYGGVLHFAATTMTDQTSLAAMRNRIGVRKVEASGLCNHPFPSDDPYYIQSLPSCDDPDLAPGQECGKVERQQVNYENNPFSADVMNSQLNGMMEDCQIVEEDVTEVIRSSEMENKFCGRSEPASFPGCSVTHNIDVEQRTVWQDGDVGEPGRLVTKTYVSDSWDGTARCKNLINKVANYDSMCTYNMDYSSPTCRTINGVTICEGDELHSQLTASPSGYGNKLTPSISISDVDCETQSGSVSYEGQSFDLEPYNYCTQYETDAACDFIQSECINETSTELGSWCSEWQDQYQCEEITEREVTETRTKMVCGNQDIYCADGSCLDQQDRAASEGFAKAAAMLSAVQGIASHTECSDPTRSETCKVFGGEWQVCRKGKGGFESLWNCCDIAGGSDALAEGNFVEAILEDGAKEIFVGPNVEMFFSAAKNLLQFFVPCKDQEIELATSKEIDAVVYLGSFCGEEIDVGFDEICIRTDRSYCAWGTTLGRVIMEEAKPQVGGGFGHKKNPDCSGLTIAQLESLDWSQIDLQDWADKLIETGNLPKGDMSDLGNDPSAWTPENNPGGVGWGSQ